LFPNTSLLCRPIENKIVIATVNPGDEALVSEYEPPDIAGKFSKLYSSVAERDAFRKHGSVEMERLWFS
jgi:hypothetical protein